MIVERMLGHLEDDAKKRQGRRPTSDKDLTDVEKREPERATAQAAKFTGTNRQYVSDAKKLRQEAPEQAERVERGEISISAAKLFPNVGVVANYGPSPERLRVSSWYVV